MLIDIPKLQFYFPISSKGKAKPFKIIEKDDSGKFVRLFIKMGEDVLGSADYEIASVHVKSTLRIRLVMLKHDS